jgi:transcriptional regulator with XRE-family HTH domain
MALAEAAVPEWTFGERLAKARKHVGLTQESMAARMNVSASAIAKWESDRGEPRAFQKTISEWAEVTGVDQAWLMGFRTGSFWTPVVLTNPDLVQPSLPFDRHLESV